MKASARIRRATVLWFGAAAVFSMVLVPDVGIAGQPAGAPDNGGQGKVLRQGQAARRQGPNGHHDHALPVAAPQSLVAGKSISDWTSDHIRWTVSFPVDANPVFSDETGDLAYLGDVGGPVFFAGTASDVQRQFQVPCGKYLLIPLLTQVAFLDEQITEEVARAENSAFVDSVTTLYARIDGRRVRNIFHHREASPDVFSVSIPNGGVLGDVGAQFDSVADGYWLMIKPLPSGRHTIVFGGDSPAYEFGYHARFEVTVPRGCRVH